MLGSTLHKMRHIAEYQFGAGTGKILFPHDVTFSFSPRTGRTRHVYLSGDLLATLRPSDGLFSLTLEGAQRFLHVKPLRLWVEVQDHAACLIARGRSVFAKHVSDCDREIRPGEEVVVVNSQRRLLAIGKALLTGKEMVVFQRGVAVRVRRGKD
jgi:predicted RNA-binding protein (TIGR00451 family)